jgi:hypothetical protein
MLPLLVDDMPIAQVEPEQVGVRLLRKLGPTAQYAGRIAIFIVSVGALRGRELLSRPIPPMPDGANGYIELLGYGLVGEALLLELETALDD